MSEEAAPHMGPKNTMIALADYLGSRAPKADPGLKDPRSSLALALYGQLDGLSGSELNGLLRQLRGERTGGTRSGLLKEAKGIVSDALDVDSREPVDNPTAAWKMWPLVITRKERDVSKQATKKKAPTKRTAKPDKKVSAKKKTTAKKAPAKVEPRKAATGRKGKPAAAKLLKPVGKDGKRGQVLAKFCLKTPKTPDAAAKELKTNRSNVLSHLHDLNRYHGIGYELDGDGPVEIFLPKGCKTPWA